MRFIYKKFKYFLIIALFVPFFNGFGFDIWRTKSDIPANVTITDTLFFNSDWWASCSVGTYRISAFDFDNLDLVEKGFHSFQVGEIGTSETPYIVLPSIAHKNLLSSFDYCLETGEIKDIFIRLVSNEDMIISYHSDLNRFLLYDKKNKFLFYVT